MKNDATFDELNRDKRLVLLLQTDHSDCFWVGLGSPGVEGGFNSLDQEGSRPGLGKM